MTGNDGNKGSRNTNALAMVAGALLALLAVLGFLALISHRAGAQQLRATSRDIGVPHAAWVSQASSMGLVPAR